MQTSRQQFYDEKVKKIKRTEQIEKSGLPCVASTRFGGSRIEFVSGRKEKVNFAPLINLLTACDQRMLPIRQMTYTTFDMQYIDL